MSQNNTDSLAQYMVLAMKNNPSVQQKLAQYEAAIQKVPQSGSLPDPQLTMGIYLSPMEIASGKQIADIQLMQMFPWFGTRRYARDEMSLMAQAKYKEYEDAQYQVVYNIQQSWYSLYRIQQTQRIVERNIAILQSLERLAKGALSATAEGGSSSSSSRMTTSNSPTASTGMATMGNTSTPVKQNPSANMPSTGMPASNQSGLADVYTIRIEMGELTNRAASLTSQLSAETAMFNSYLNRPMQSPVALPDTVYQDSVEFPLQSNMDTMLRNNPMLGMFQYEQQSLDARKQMLVRMSYPMVGIGLSYSIVGKDPMSASAMNGKDMLMPMLTVALPIYRNKYRAMQNETEKMKIASSYSYTAAYNMLQTEYYRVLQQVQDAERQLKLYEEQAQLSNQLLSLKIKSFSASQSDLADVQRARQQLLDYELKQLDALIQYNTAKGQFRKLLAQSTILQQPEK